MSIWKWIDKGLEAAQKYSPLIKTGVAALSTYASFKDQQKKNEMQQAAYDDYMAQADAAGHAARAAIDVNYTPMTVSGVPTSKADVTDFTAVAAKGGLMSIPNKQRKRYATGPEEFEVQEMDEEIFSPGDFKMETGVDVLGEQVFYDTGKGDRSNAQMIWGQMQDPDKAIFDFDFEIFFMDGGWRDMIKSQVDVQEDTQMASAPDPTAEMNDFSIQEYGKALHELTPAELEALYDLANDQAAAPAAEGIMQAAKGGRIGYREGIGPNQGSPSIMAEAITDSEVEDAYGQSVEHGPLLLEIKQIAEQSVSPQDFPATDSDYMQLEILSDKHKVDLEVVIEMAKGTHFTAPQQSKGEEYAQYMARGGRPGYATQGFVGTTAEEGDIGLEEKIIHPGTLTEGDIGMPGQATTGFEHEGAIAEDESGLMQVAKIVARLPISLNPLHVWKTMKMAGVGIAEAIEIVKNKFGEEEITEEEFEITPAAKGGRIKKAPGGIMNLGGLEKDYRTTGGFVPIGAYEKKDDVPARLSKNEFVMTADAVRAAGGGSINRGAQRMYDTMKHLEASPQSKRMTA